MRPLMLIFLVYLTAVIACAHSPNAGAGSAQLPDGGLYEELMRVYVGPLNHLKAVRRGECPMYPSCSQYSQQAVARYGLVKGWMMTMDRLMRCGRDETRRAPRILIDGKWKYYDPVEDNAGCP